MSRLDLGVGLTWFPAWSDRLAALDDVVTVLEIEPQTLCWEAADGPLVLDPEAVSDVRAMRRTVLVHGVSSPVGSSRVPTTQEIDFLAASSIGLEAPLVSEHLSFNRTSGADGGMSFAGLLLPPRQTNEGLRCSVDAVVAVSDRLPVPFSVETGVNYLRPLRDELSDGVFVAGVAERADCGILLDLHNIWANERNGRQRVEDFVLDLPLERVLEVHVAGGFEYRGYWLDAHSGAVPQPLMDIADWVLPLLPSLRAVILEVLPGYVPGLDLELVRKQLSRLGAVASRPTKRSPSRRARPHAPLDAVPGDRVAPKQWEDSLAALAAGANDHGDADELASDPAIGILNILVRSARAGQLSDGLRLTLRGLLLALGADLADDLLAEYMRELPPQLSGSAESRQFGSWLEGRDDVMPLVVDVAKLEVGAAEAMRQRRTVEVCVGVDPWTTMDALGRGTLPQPTLGNFVVQIAP